MDMGERAPAGLGPRQPGLPPLRGAAEFCAACPAHGRVCEFCLRARGSWQYTDACGDFGHVLRGTDYDASRRTLAWCRCTLDIARWHARQRRAN
eukprot:5583050-Prymnesium_polylepis.1